MDWDKLEDEAVTYLQEYIRIDTSNPPGNEAPGAQFLADILEDEGIPVKTYESAPGRVSTLACLEGEGSGKPLILLNHIDVVPADPAGWEINPFSGEIADGYIWGRGSLDMKGMAIMELVALLGAKREGIRLGRDVVFLAVADEEAGGQLGAKYIIEKDPAAIDAHVVINEGGFINTNLVADMPFFLIGSGEKSGAWLKLVRHGQAGHGSMPTGQGALERLVQALARLLANPRPIEIDPIMQTFFGKLAEYWDFLKPYRDDCRPQTLRRLIEENNIMAIPALAATLHDTVSLNMLQAGTKINVIPDKAEAQVDCRILPETALDEFLDYFRESLDDPEITVTFGKEFEISGSSPTDNESYATIVDVIKKHYPGSVISPFLLSGISDSRFFRQMGIPSYGMIPARLGLADISRIHGINERIAISDLKEGVRFLYDLLVALCA